MGKKKREAALIAEAKERGFFDYPHKWEGMREERTACAQLKYEKNGGFLPYLYDKPEGNIIWWSDQGWATVIKPEVKKPILEKKKPIFTTEDGVDIYKGDKYWVTNIADKDYPWKSEAIGTYYNPEFIRFSTKQAAQDWIEKQKIEARAYTEAMLTLKGLEDAFTALGKSVAPKSLKPEELVDGEIYYDEKSIPPRILRFKRSEGLGSNLLLLYSELLNDGQYWTLIDGYLAKSIRPATLEEKQKLITAEVNNGFFYNLK